MNSKQAKKPDFNEISRIEERLLHDKLVAVRQLISHPSEKGRSLEREVSAVLRDLLPPEYGLGTGFIVFHGSNGPELSSQLDIIIYDAIRGGPLGRLAACDVYPIETVYGYVEVKTSLRVMGPNVDELAENSIQRCLQKNHELRQMRKRLYWHSCTGGSPISTELVAGPNLSIRGFVFAFEADGLEAKDASSLAQEMANHAKRYDAHLHGVLILDHAYLTTIPVDVETAGSDDYYHVAFTTTDTFTAFKLHLLKALGTFPRSKPEYVSAVDQYFNTFGQWQESLPTSDSDDTQIPGNSPA